MSDDLVPNPYRVAIAAQQRACLDDEDLLRDCLRHVLEAFEGGAWIGGQGRVVHEILAAMRDDLATVSYKVDDEFDSAWCDQPAEVEPDAWQIHWRNLGPR